MQSGLESNLRAGSQIDLSYSIKNLSIPTNSKKTSIKRKGKEIVLVSMAIGRPFTLPYARERGRKNSGRRSDEQVCERWVYDPYFQYFTGE
jgi:hypothetical protein